MAAHTVRSIFFSIVGILISGALGGFAGWAAVTLLGLSGVAAALLAAVVGMVVATAVWVGLTVAMRALGALQ